MKKSTITDLPTDIMAALPNWEEYPSVVEIIEEAKKGEFHDYKNNKHVCGKVAVVHLLYETKLPELVPIRQAIIDGEYDETPDAEDEAQMKKDWLDDGGTEDSFNKLFKS